MRSLHHAKHRVKERYGIKLNRKEIRFLNKAIKHKNPEVLKNVLKEQTRTRSVLHITYKDIDMVVVYSYTAEAIITFLPKHTFHTLLF